MCDFSMRLRVSWSNQIYLQIAEDQEMKQHKRTASRLIAGLGGVIVAGSVGSVLASPGYAVDSAGKVVTSYYGECVQTGSWKQELSTPECDAALAARLEAERLAAEKDRQAARLAALESPAAAPAPRLARLSDKSNVMFEFNSAVLTPAATQELGKVLGMIREFDEIDSVEIVGHTDSTGPDSYNQALSERRAASVRQLLESRGVRSSVVSARGEGEGRPVADNSTRDGRARNRRVDILISGNSVE
ncbi:MAG: OmpA family protein [Gammaproteobacteria bacterium]|nr:OmpA family protein [Gammaproteobacteria bacterium]